MFSPGWRDRAPAIIPQALSVSGGDSTRRLFELPSPAASTFPIERFAFEEGGSSLASRQSLHILSFCRRRVVQSFAMHLCEWARQNPVSVMLLSFEQSSTMHTGFGLLGLSVGGDVGDEPPQHLHFPSGFSMRWVQFSPWHACV